MNSETDVLFRIQPNWKIFSVLTCAGENPLISFIKAHLILNSLVVSFVKETNFKSCMFPAILRKHQ